MNISLISAAIALLGVITSVIISFLSNKKMFKTEIEKIEVGIEQNYANKLVEKRLIFYPVIYEPLSNMSKKIRRIIFEDQGENIVLQEIIEFQKIYDEMNSKYGVVFSSISSENSKNLRVSLSEIIIKYNKTNLDVKISKDVLNILKTKIRNLEFSLKQDLGIYIVELKDPKKKLALKEYDDVKKYL